MLVLDKIIGPSNVLVGADRRGIKNFYIHPSNETQQDTNWLNTDLVLRNGSYGFELSGILVLVILYLN